MSSLARSASMTVGAESEIGPPVEFTGEHPEHALDEGDIHLTASGDSPHDRCHGGVVTGDLGLASWGAAGLLA
jgi:hypothetical protein